MCEGKLVAPLTFEGSCNRVVFEKWLGEKLLPQLKTGQLVILDNASFHKSQKVRELIESVNCELEYLPPYSPDLNEIEHYWFPNRWKKSLKLRQSNNFKYYRQSTAIILTYQGF